MGARRYEVRHDLLAVESSVAESAASGKYLLLAPDAVFDNPFGGGSFGPEVKAEYLETYRDPTRVHAICEEYRAAAGLDIEHDKADQKASKRITCPMLWAA